MLVGLPGTKLRTRGDAQKTFPRNDPEKPRRQQTIAGDIKLLELLKWSHDIQNVKDFSRWSSDSKTMWFRAVTWHGLGAQDDNHWIRSQVTCPSLYAPWQSKTGYPVTRLHIYVHMNAHTECIMNTLWLHMNTLTLIILWSHLIRIVKMKKDGKVIWGRFTQL